MKKRSWAQRLWESLSRITRWRLTDPDAMSGIMGSNQATAGVTVDQWSSLSLSGVFAAVNLLGNVIGSLPLEVFRYQRAGRKREMADSHPAHWLLCYEPNPEMSAITMRCTLEMHRLLWGNCYVEIQWAANGQPAALWPIAPWRVRPVRLPDLSLAFRVDGARDIAPADMLHCPLVSWDGVVGRSFIDYAFESLGLSIATQQYAGAFFGNGARPGVILKIPGQPTEAERLEKRKGWEARHRGPGKAGGTALIWGGMEVLFDESMTPEASQLLEQRRFAIEEVARWLNIPPHLLRELSRATFSNIEHQGIDFSTHTIGPIVKRYEQEIDRKLLSPPQLYCKHDLEELKRGDSQAVSNKARTLWGIGAVSQNEVRGWFNMNPIEGGDEFFVPANMVSLSKALATEKTPEPVGSPTGEGDQEDDQAPGPEEPGGPGGEESPPGGVEEGQ